MIEYRSEKSATQEDSHIQELERRLKEAEETLEAIRTGTVDAIVVSGEKGQQVFTLEGADSPYRAIIETMSEGAVTLSREGVIMYCNQRFSDILNAPLQKLIGSSFLPLVERDHAKTFKAMLKSSRAGRAEGEVRLRTSDGSSVPVYISGNGYALLHGDAAVCLMVTDISELSRARDVLKRSHDELEKRVEERTRELSHANAELKAEIVERRRAEDEVRRSRDQLEWVLDTTGVGLWLNTLPLKNLVWDARTKDFFFVPPDAEPTIELFWSRLHPEDREPTRLAVEAAVRDGTFYSIEHRAINPTTGEIRWICSAGKAVYGPDGNAIRFDGINYDITDRRQMADALRESEERFRLFMDNSPAIAWIKDEEGKYVYASKAYEKAMGLCLRDLIGKKDIELWPEHAGEFRKNDVAVLSEGKAIEVIEQTRNPEGLSVYWSNFKFPLSDSSGKLFVAGIGVNATDRKHAEEALQKAKDELELRVQERTQEVRQALEALAKERQRLYHVLETLPAMVCLLSPDYRVPFANRAFRERFGEAEDRPCYEYRYGKSEPCEFCESFKVLQTNKPHRWEVTTADGRVIDAHDYPFTDVDGKTLILEMNFDITEQKHADKALQRASAYNRSLIEVNVDPLIAIDPEGHISDVNVATEQATGYSRHELIGTDFSDYFTDPGKARAGYLRVFRDGSVRDYPLDILHKDGHSIPVLYNASVYRDEAGRVLGVFAAARDISIRQKLEEQLRQAHKMEAIGTLAGGIAHDFNNMLAVILGNAELALDQLDQDGPRQNIKQILKASMRSRDLVKQILTFSRKNAGQEKAVHIVPLLKETYQLLRGSLPSTIDMKLNIRTKADTTILFQSSEIQQVAVNLANNAAYAMREEGGTLSIGLSSITIGSDSPFEESMRPGRYVKLTVKDTGTGIHPEVQKRMFEPFFTTKEQGQGTGMGLAVAYGIVKAHNGVIEVESEVGKGSMFTVLLPQYDVLSTKEQEEETSLACPRKERILFIDDERAVVEITKTVLERLGCHVTAFTDASEALNAFIEHPDSFDLIITDQTMPGMTGTALAKEALDLRKDIPIILCTGYSETVSPKKAKEVGIRELIMKPLTKQEIAEAIRRVID